MEKIYRSEEQRTVEGWRTSILCGKEFENTIDEVEVVEHHVQDKDIIVMCSDGVTENLFDELIRQNIGSFMKGKDLQNIPGASMAIA